MSGGPFPFARQQMPLDDMLASAGGLGWAGLAERLGLPSADPDVFAPEDDLKRQMAAFYRTDLGRRMFEWLGDLTLRGAPGASGQTIESAAIAHAKHEARFAVGLAMLKAIEDGDKLLNQKETAR